MKPWRSMPATLLLLAGCQPPVEDGQFEIAAELRALRLQLQQRPANDTGEVRSALQPLREVLDQLAREQRELAQRQQQLMAALQLQARLEQATDAARPELQAMVERLRQVEAELQAQTLRQREVEEQMASALERTGERLDQLLQRLPLLGGTTAEPSAEPLAEPTAEPAVEPKPKAPAASEAVGNRRIGRLLRANDDERAAWLGVGGLALLTGLGFLWRWRQLRRPGERAERGGMADRPHGGFDRGVDDLWRAASLLGEPVGEPAAPAKARPAEAAAAAQLQAAEFAIDDRLPEDRPLGAQQTEDQPPEDRQTEDQQTENKPTAATPGPESMPPRLCWRLPCADPAAALSRLQRRLASDPRVLRWPPPQLLAEADAIQISLHVLPELPPAERTALWLAVRALA